MPEKMYRNSAVNKNKTRRVHFCCARLYAQLATGFIRPGNAVYCQCQDINDYAQEDKNEKMDVLSGTTMGYRRAGL